MEIRNFSGLYEDEVMEEIDNAGPHFVIKWHKHEYKPIHTTPETPVHGIFHQCGRCTRYVNGTRAGIVPCSYLVDLLPHEDFTIEVDDFFTLNNYINYYPYDDFRVIRSVPGAVPVLVFDSEKRLTKVTPDLLRAKLHHKEVILHGDGTCTHVLELKP